MITDSHCHLDAAVFAKDADNTLNRARSAGVGRFLVVGTSMADAGRTLAFAKSRADVFATIGVHPHYTDRPGENPTPTRLIEVAQTGGAVGLGETGLDFNRNRAPAAAQEGNFRRHIEAALGADLPLVIHTRDADDATMRLVDAADPSRKLRGVLHCFDGGQALAEWAVARGLLVSFSGILTYTRSEKLRTIARGLPLASLLVETDAPYLSPEPVRKQRRNEPAAIVHTVRMLAGLHGVDEATVATATTANFADLFQCGG